MTNRRTGITNTARRLLMMAALVAVPGLGLATAQPASATA
jgi:hypothetical protein